MIRTLSLIALVSILLVSSAWAKEYSLIPYTWRDTNSNGIVEENELTKNKRWGANGLSVEYRPGERAFFGIELPAGSTIAPQYNSATDPRIMSVVGSPPGLYGVLFEEGLVGYQYASVDVWARGVFHKTTSSLHVNNNAEKKSK
jgi:hypothetical protein